jgi:hypothetical protein
MAMSGFGLYHGLWLDDTPTKPITTPWAMMDALGLVKILQAHEQLVPPQTAFFVTFWSLQYKCCVRWILAMKGGVRVGKKVSKREGPVRLDGGTYSN